MKRSSNKISNISGFLIVVIPVFVLFLGVFVLNLLLLFRNETKNYQCRDLSHKKIEKVVVNIENSSLKLEALDWDENGYMYSGYDFDKFFDVDIQDNCLYIKNKNNINLEDYNREQEEKYKINFILPRYYDNNIDFNISIINGDLIVSGYTNMNNISCDIKNGDITGDYIIAKKINLSVDENHRILIKKQIETENPGRHLITITYRYS